MMSEWNEGNKNVRYHPDPERNEIIAKVREMVTGSRLAGQRASDVVDEFLELAEMSGENSNDDGLISLLLVYALGNSLTNEQGQTLKNLVRDGGSKDDKKSTFAVQARIDDLEDEVHQFLKYRGPEKHTYAYVTPYGKPTNSTYKLGRIVLAIGCARVASMMKNEYGPTGNYVKTYSDRRTGKTGIWVSKQEGLDFVLDSDGDPEPKTID